MMTRYAAIVGGSGAVVTAGMFIFEGGFALAYAWAAGVIVGVLVNH